MCGSKRVVVLIERRSVEVIQNIGTWNCGRSRQVETRNTPISYCFGGYRSTWGVLVLANCPMGNSKLGLGRLEDQAVLAGNIEELFHIGILACW